MTSDKALMLEFQGGSRAAFEELPARYRKPLYCLFGRRLNNAARAEDLVQETFLASDTPGTRSLSFAVVL